MNTKQLLLSFIAISANFCLAMDNEQIIKGSAFYIFYKGDAQNEHHEKAPSSVTFFGKDRCDIIAKKELDTLDLTTEQEKKFNAMIDPIASAKIKPYRVHIKVHIWYGRGIGIFDKEDKWIAGNIYYGDADIKSPEVRKNLLKPTSLLDSVKIVEEDTFFFHPYQKITYFDDGSKKVEISKSYRHFQCGLLLSSLCAVYLLYRTVFSS